MAPSQYGHNAKCLSITIRFKMCFYEFLHFKLQSALDQRLQVAALTKIYTRPKEHVRPLLSERGVKSSAGLLSPTSQCRSV